MEEGVNSFDLGEHRPLPLRWGVVYLVYSRWVVFWRFWWLSKGAEYGGVYVLFTIMLGIRLPNPPNGHFGFDTQKKKSTWLPIHAPPCSKDSRPSDSNPKSSVGCACRCATMCSPLHRHAWHKSVPSEGSYREWMGFGFEAWGLGLEFGF